MLILKCLEMSPKDRQTDTVTLQVETSTDEVQILRNSCVQDNIE